MSKDHMIQKCSQKQTTSSIQHAIWLLVTYIQSSLKNQTDSTEQPSGNQTKFCFPGVAKKYSAASVNEETKRLSMKEKKKKN